MPLPQDRTSIDVPSDEVRHAVLTELLALAGRAGVDTDRGTWASLHVTGDDPDGAPSVRAA
jgi:hypothetical protein